IGIDIGTTRVKAGVIAADGGVVDYFSRAYPTARRSTGIAEQDARDWNRLIDEALEQFAPHADNVAAIGLCSQVNTHVFVDADLQPLMPAIIWQDTRAVVQAKELDARVSTQQRMTWWGAPMPIDASHALSRMAWVSQTHQDTWQQTRWVLLPKDFCIAHLTGQPITDGLSNIGLTAPDLTYVDGALDLVDGAAERLAPIKPVLGFAGNVSHGPFKGTPIATCTMDAWTGLVGTGGVAKDTAGYLSGTSEILGINSAQVHPTAGVIVFGQAHGVRLHAGPTQSGGASLQWLCNLFATTPVVLMEGVATCDFNRPAPLFLPHLQGERAPLWNPALRGVFANLDHTSGRSDMGRAVLEGVAFSVRQALEALEASAGAEVKIMRGGGGGFQSDIWNQIRANVLGRKVDRVAVKDPGVIGAAGLAACAAGHFHTLEDAFENLAVVDATYVPDAQAHARYEDVYAQYLEAIDANAPINARLSQPPQNG
ncbi:MAG: FGGY-family carbohydrate kinase, partial [Pseudomonadota bacterium]